MKEKGQSLIEVIFAVVAIGMTLTGVVVLLSSSLARINKGFDRKKAAEMGRSVIEDLVAKRREDPAGFWQLDPEDDKTMAEFPGYVYSIGYSAITSGSGCATPVSCAQATVTVEQVGNTDPSESVQLVRFFYKENY